MEIQNKTEQICKLSRKSKKRLDITLAVTNFVGLKEIKIGKAMSTIEIK